MTTNNPRNLARRIRREFKMHPVDAREVADLVHWGMLTEDKLFKHLEAERREDEEAAA